MDIENQIIEVKINNFNYEHFISLGYNVKSGDVIKIRAKELPNGSSKKVLLICNYCNSYFYKEWRRYILTKDDICCSNCKKYKIMKISKEKYGNICSLRNENILKKSKETNLAKYGVEYPLQNEDIRNKCSKTRYENFIKNKNEIACSKTQIYLSNLYNGVINKNFGKYFVDIYLKKYNIVVEYDGTGHDLSVRMGTESIEEYLEKEHMREEFLFSIGLKIMRIKYMDSKDSLPQDSEMITYLNDAIKYFNNGYKKYIIDLKTKTISVKM